MPCTGFRLEPLKKILGDHKAFALGGHLPLGMQIILDRIIRGNDPCKHASSGSPYACSHSDVVLGQYCSATTSFGVLSLKLFNETSKL